MDIKEIPNPVPKPQPPKNLKELFAQIYEVWKNPVTRKKVLKKALFKNLFE